MEDKGSRPLNLKKIKHEVEMKDLLWPGDGHEDHAHGVDQLAPDVDRLGSKPFHQLI
jgi:hypothetical protein